MKFEDLWVIHTEGFDSLQTQDAQTGNSQQHTNQGLTPAQYRNTAASAEGEEDEGPTSNEEANARSILEFLKTFRGKGMDANDVDLVISKLVDLERKLDTSLT
jgi:hypothetical protein|tara:strand:- start:30 stop:338 length:309 start_codon:yes stop_codon:yes gene_type:complete